MQELKIEMRNKFSLIIQITELLLVIVTIYLGWIQLNRLEAQIEDARKNTSAQLVVSLKDQLLSGDNSKILSAIYDNRPILKDNGGKFVNFQLNDYLGIYQTLYNIWSEDLITDGELCNIFSNSIEVTNRNKEIKNYLSKINLKSPNPSDSLDIEEIPNFKESLDNLVYQFDRGICDTPRAILDREYKK